MRIPVRAVKIGALVTRRFVATAFVAKRLVVVASVVVLLSPVKFCKVVEPVTSMVAKLFAPENVLLFARRVVDETVIVPPRETDVPLMVIAEFARSVFATVAQVAAPPPLSERTN